MPMWGTIAPDADGFTITTTTTIIVFLFIALSPPFLACCLILALSLPTKRATRRFKSGHYGLKEASTPIRIGTHSLSRTDLGRPTCGESLERRRRAAVDRARHPSRAG